MTDTTTLANRTDLSIALRGSTLPASWFEAPNSNVTLVVLHDLFGLNEWAHYSAQRLASLGFNVIAPDLFADVTLPSGEEGALPNEAALRDFVMSLSNAKIVEKAITALEEAAARGNANTRFGIVGWGWGGAYALMAAAHDARFGAVADIGGDISYAVLTANRPGSPLNFVASLEAPLFAAFPAEDPQFQPVEVERLRARLIEHDKQGEVKRYTDAGPRFWADDNAPQTALLWRRLEEFLRGALFEEDDVEADFATGPYPNEESRLHA